MVVLDAILRLTPRGEIAIPMPIISHSAKRLSIAGVDSEGPIATSDAVIEEHAGRGALYARSALFPSRVDRDAVRSAAVLREQVRRQAAQLVAIARERSIVAHGSSRLATRSAGKGKATSGFGAKRSSRRYRRGQG